MVDPAAPPVSASNGASVAAPKPFRRWAGLLVMLAWAVVAALLSLLLGPHPLSLGAASGDDALRGEVEQVIAGDTAGFGELAVGTLRDGEQAVATFGDGVTPSMRFELGSITKTFTGHLLAIGIEQGEVALDDPLGAHLDELAGTPIGEVTLEELTTHTAGLPSVATEGIEDLVLTTESVAGQPLGVYDISTEELVARAASVTPDPALRGVMVYSNFGVSLLGHALAEAAGAADWATLLHERLLAPLGMDATFVGSRIDDKPLASPHLAGGLPVDSWMHGGTGYAPAGTGVTTTVEDLLTYAGAVLDGSVPGLAALEPLSEPSPIAPGAPSQRVGMGWMIIDDAEQAPVAWHNGGTGGTRTVIVIDVAQQQAAVALNASTRDVTGLGMLLVGAEGWPVSLPDVQSIMSGALSVLCVLQLLVAALFSRSRITLVSWWSLAAAGVVLLGVTAPWAVLPAWLFGASVGLLAAGTWVGVRRWPQLRWLPRTLIVRILSFLLAAAMAVNVVWTLVILILRLFV